MTCPICGKDFSRDCLVCREGRRLTPLKLLTEMPWPTHDPVWTDRNESAMICSRCGIPILPSMMMRELFGPCSAKQEAR